MLLVLLLLFTDCALYYFITQTYLTIRIFPISGIITENLL